ncbi:9052_t:CDS:2, partial [Cetraspora pellucida]
MAGQNQDINISTADGSQKSDKPQNTQLYPTQSAQDIQQHPSQEPQDTQLYPPHNAWANPPSQLSYNQPYEQYNPQYQQQQQQLNAYDNNPFYDNGTFNQPTAGHSQVPSGGIANTYDPNYNQTTNFNQNADYNTNVYNPNYNPFQNQNFNTYDSINPYGANAYSNTGETGNNFNAYGGTNAYTTGADTNAYTGFGTNTYTTGAEANTYSSSIGTETNTYTTAAGTNANKNTGGNENNNSTTINTEAIAEKKENSNDNNVSVSLASAVNPGVETTDPSKLNPPEKPEKKHRPSGKRFFFRLSTLVASAGALGFIIGAPLYSKQGTPVEANKFAIYFLYVVSGLSILISLYFLVLYCVRRWNDAKKISRILLHIIDFVFAASFGVLMVFMIKDFRCPINGRDGWCDFYNTSIFFTVLCC